MITRDHAVFMDLPVVFDLDALLPRRATDRVGRHLRGTRRDHAAVRHGRRRPLVRGRPVLRVPSAQRLRRRLDRGVRRRPTRHAVARLDGRLRAVVPAPLDVRPRAGGPVTETPLDDVSHAFPRVDDRVVGLCHRYGWAAAPRAGSDGTDSTIRASSSSTTCRRETSTMLRPRTGAPTPASSSSCASPTASAEDDGWAMGLVYDATTDRSDLVILDAADAAPTRGSRPPAPARAVRLPRQLDQRR